MASGYKFYSDKQEKMIAGYMSSSLDVWKQVTGSGSRPNHPGDVVSSQWLGECKTHITSGNKIIFIFDVWNKISNEASSCFKHPVLFTDDGSQDLNRTYSMIKIDNMLSQSFQIVDDYTKKSSYRKFVKDIGNCQCIKYKNQCLLVCKIQIFKQLVDSKVL